MIEVETPDGGIAEFPDGTPPDVIKAALRKKFPQPQTVNTAEKVDRERSWGETAMDAGLGALQGISDGAQGLAGSFGDAQSMLGSVGSWGAGLVGASPEAQNWVGDIAARLPAMGMKFPTTQQVNQLVEPVVGRYTPQTELGRYAESVGEFVPAAVAGPGGVVRKAAMAAVPGVATQFTSDMTDQNPYATTGVGIVTGLLTAGRAGSPGTKGLLGKVGDADKAYARVKSSADKAYTDLRSAGVKYDANAVDQAINDIAGMRIETELAPKASGLVKYVSKFAGKGMDFEDLDNVERIATGLLRENIGGTDKKFVSDILTRIKDVRQSGAFITNGTVPAGDLNALIGQAKDLGRRKILADNITEMKRRLPGYLAGDESAYRNQFGAYLKSPESKSLTPQEKKAFGAVVNREGPLNVAHNLGSRWGQIAGGSTGSVVGGLLGSMFGPAGTAVGAMAGAGISMGTQNLFRKFMDVYTEKGVDNAIKTVLAGKSAQQKAEVLDLLERYRANVGRLLMTDTALNQGGNGGAAPVPSTGLLGVPR